MTNRVEILKEKFVQSLGLPFAEILPASEIEEMLVEENIRYRNRLFTPMVTLWMFLSQVLDTDKSLQNAVNRVIAWLATEGEELPSTDTGAYSKARARLPEKLCKLLFGKSGKNLEHQVEPKMLWCGHRVYVCDGSSVLMSDTSANQKAYPQHSNQKPGCGFPLAKLVVIFSLVTGAAVEVIIAPFNSGEVTLARQLYQMLQPGDVSLADRAYGTYADLALVQARGAHGVFRKHHKRNKDFRRGKRLGKGDYLVEWHKPKQCPASMTPAEYEALPDKLMVREVYCVIEEPGFRTQQVTVVTTLLDPKRYPTAKLALLYKWRWRAETDLKHVKTTLGMEMLGGKTPEMVRKEIYIHLLAYNLLRNLMWQAAQSSGVEPLQVSLQHTRQLLRHFLSELKDVGQTKLKRLYQHLLDSITHKLVPKRPNRAEPRVKKRRPKAYPLMQKPRSELKAALAG